MSEHSEAKDFQVYRETPDTCSRCMHFVRDTKPIAWMEEQNRLIQTRGWGTTYDLSLEQNRVERNLQCSIGLFKVKKTAVCNLFERKIKT